MRSRDAIAGALQVKLSPETAPPRRHTPNLRAYEAYLKALDQWSKSDVGIHGAGQGVPGQSGRTRSGIRACAQHAGPVLHDAREPRHQADTRGHPLGPRGGSTRHCASSLHCLKPMPSVGVLGFRLRRLRLARGGTALARGHGSRTGLMPRPFLVREPLPAAHRPVPGCPGRHGEGARRGSDQPLVPPPFLRSVSETPAGSRRRKPSCTGSWSSMRTFRWPSARSAPSARSKVDLGKRSR